MDWRVLTVIVQALVECAVVVIVALTVEQTAVVHCSDGALVRVRVTLDVRTRARCDTVVIRATARRHRVGHALVVLATRCTARVAVMTV
jgi:hypothetical protein